jgi:hypothetical protein
MGFNLGAFIGGAATRGSEIIQEREERMLKLQDEQRRIAQANAAKAAAKREAELEEMKELTGKLSLFYNEDQVKDILSNGKIAANYAVVQGASYAEAGLNPSAEYEMPASKIASGVSKATVDNKPSMGTMGGEATPLIKTDKTLEAIPAGEPTRGGSFAGRFKPIPDKVTTSAKTFEARLVELTFAKANARDEDEATKVQKQIDQVMSSHQKFKSDAKKEYGTTEGLDFSKTTRDSLVNAELDRQFELAGMAEKDINGKISMIQTGNEANSFALRYGAHNNLLNNYKEVKDDIFQRQIASVKTDTDRSVSAYKSSKVRASAVIIDPKNTQQSVQAAAAQGQYKQGDVVQYSRPDGSTGYALISDYGVFF